MVAESGSFLTPSRALLVNHFDEILGTIEEIRGLAALLKSRSPGDEKRDEYEGRLYVALTHLDHHVRPAIKEWNRVVDRMSDDRWLPLHVPEQQDVAIFPPMLRPLPAARARPTPR